MNADQTNDVAAWHARKLIRWCLTGSKGMSLAALVRQTDMDEQTIRREVSRLVDEGQVSRIRAWSITSHEKPFPQREGHCYRWNGEDNAARRPRRSFSGKRRPEALEHRSEVPIVDPVC
jgi:predicted ArsR family transcriptional regulator